MVDSPRGILSHETGNALRDVLENTFINIKSKFDDEAIQRIIKYENQFQDMIIDAAAKLNGGMLTSSESVNTIDCDADPFTPDGWRVEEHRKGGQFVFDSSKISLYLYKNQHNDKYVTGNKLRKELLGLPVLNANVLDYLLKRTELIPEHWKKDQNASTRAICFWGTIYSDSGGRLSIRYLCFRDGAWCWDCRWIVNHFCSNNPAALHAM